jgi:DNA polymerase-3 subunit delta'
MNRLSDIFGQDEAIGSLRAAIASDRLPHGLIFAGLEGVGKATTAAGLAAFFLCEKPGDGDACGKCKSCQAMGSGNHPDYHVITKELARVHDRGGTSKATQLSINVIRYDLAEPAGRKTVLGRGKFFVVERAELMTDAAQNALLKTLEEPAGRSLIVLLTTHANELLPTIRSRCQTVRFAALPMEMVVKDLRRRGIDAGAAQAAAEFSDGSLGLAMRWIEDGILSHATGVAAAMDSLLAVKDAELADLLRKGADAYAAKALERDELASKDSAVRTGLGVYLAFASRRIRQKMRGTDDESFLDRACDAVDAIARAEKYLGANVNVSLVLEQLAGALQGEIGEPLRPRRAGTGC